MLMAPDRAEDLEDSWASLRPDYIRSDWRLPEKGVVQQWALGNGTSNLAAVEGPTASHRMEVYRWLQPLPVLVPQTGRWVENGVHASLLSKAGVWRQLQSLIHTEGFFIDEPLRSLADQGGPPALLLQALWELRFLEEEATVVTEPLVRGLVHWITELQPHDIVRQLHIDAPLKNVQQQLELFFFLLALSAQNGCLQQQVVFIFDGAESLSDLPVEQQQARFQELKEVVKLLDRWVPLGTPLGVLVGFSRQRRFKELNVCRWLQDRCMETHGCQ